MAIFGTAASTSPVDVVVPAFRVYVAHIDDGGAAPTWGDFVLSDRLKVVEMFRGSSVAGQSYATVKMVPAAVGGDNVDVEDADILYPGDRVYIAVDEGPDRVIWCGYCVRPSLVISDGGESATWRLVGPEWMWGAEGDKTGCLFPVHSQGRRKPAVDDATIADPTVVAAWGDWGLFANLPPHFNPDGRPNKTFATADLTSGGSPIVGYLFDDADRKVNTVVRVDWWTILEAVKYIAAVYNTSASAIDIPANAAWASQPIPLDAVVKDVNVDGMGLWDALKAVIGPEYGFYVDPRPTSGVWGGKLYFFSRSASLGSAASLHLDERFTNPTTATASIIRLNAAKDTSKVVNEVAVWGTRLKHVCLRYHGGATYGLDSAKMPLSLQHGWKATEGDLATYAAAHVVDAATVDSVAGHRKTWQDKFTTGGKDFPANRHVFRLFTWNEAGEWFGAGPKYGTATSDHAVDWYRPDLEDMLDTSVYPVRRRKLLDTLYPEIDANDGFRRLGPTCLVNYIKDDGTLAEWRRLSSGEYNIDHDRGALWITKKDLAEWYPFIDHATTGGTPGPYDDQTFATLLLTGRLRLAVEACVESDSSLLGSSPFDDTGGQPIARRATYRTGAQFLRAEQYDDGQGFPLGLTPATIDDTTRAQEYSDGKLAAGRDAQFHASILVAADWPEQTIGKFLGTIAGRGINLDTGTGRAAQIVAQTLDPDAMKWELLTESAALQLKSELRKKPFGYKRKITAMTMPDDAGEFFE